MPVPFPTPPRARRSRALAVLLATGIGGFAAGAGPAHAADPASAPAPPATPAARPVPPRPGLTLEARLRHEHVDDAAFARDADATTLRLRLGYRTAVHAGVSGLVEFEHTSHLGAAHFHSSANGRTGYPAVTDPDNTELNQAWIAWAPSPAARLVLGRQRLAYDNQRFIGNSGWRQNEQTFDALDATWTSARGLQLRYGWLDGVQRVNGSDNPNHALARWNLDAHLFHAAQPLGRAGRSGTLVGYAYFIDNRTLPLTSHRDLGLRYTLKRDVPAGLGWALAAELARQDAWRDGSAAIDARYTLLEGTLAWRGHAFKLGREVLGGDGRYGFQTPLATLHPFDGWADRFTTTPADGLEDRYLGWSRRFARKFDAALVAHAFRADHGGRDYGSEVDASVGWNLTPHWTALAKLADYHAGDGAPASVRKAWLALEYVR